MALYGDEAVVRNMANLRERYVPLGTHCRCLGLFPLLDHHEHALLRFTEHDLIGRHVRLTERDKV